jgi:hypothetical protein
MIAPVLRLHIEDNTGARGLGAVVAEKHRLSCAGTILSFHPRRKKDRAQLFPLSAAFHPY